MTEATDAALAPTPRATISVFLADDNVIVREGVRALLARANDITVVGVADDLDSLISGAIQHTPDVVVSDIRSLFTPATHQAIAAFFLTQTRQQLDKLAVAKDIPLQTLSK